MRYFKALALVSLFCLSTSCLVVPVPIHVGARGPIRKKELKFLETGTAKREDVLLHLGKPEHISSGERYFDYSWIGAWDIGVLGPAGSADYIKQSCHSLRFHFDENGKVDDLSVSSYKPDKALSNNEECFFKTYSAHTLNILNLGEKRVSGDEPIFVVGQTTRMDVLKKLQMMAGNLNEDRIFWARWLSRKPDLKSMSDLDSISSEARNGRMARKRKFHNVLVEFDRRSVVLSVRQVEDENIVRELIALGTRSGYKPPDLSSLTRNSYKAWTVGRHPDNGWMSVNADSVKFWDGHRKIEFRVFLGEIAGLKLSSKSRWPAFVLKLKSKTVWGDEINVSLNPSDLLTVLMHITQKIP
jgi:hypothetical protein